VSFASALRVAFFADCFHEVNGVALTSREFQAYARRWNLPMFVFHRGAQTRLTRQGSLTVFEASRSGLSFSVDRDLRFDLLFPKLLGPLQRQLEKFQPDIVHITGPGDCGILGAILAHRLRVPLAASWHTNLHEFAARRLAAALPWLPASLAARSASAAGSGALALVLRFYRLAGLLFAPNPELARLLSDATGKPVHLMLRGVDTDLFHPSRRRRNGPGVVIGFAGRLTPEKSVRKLALVEKALRTAGIHDYRFLIAGHGGEEAWLRRNLRQAEFAGVLHGADLAEAYANMDIFAFPSATDTFGNVVQEAMASGVPPVVTGAGGPKYLVEDGRTGYITGSDEEFASVIVRLARHKTLRTAIGQSAAKRMQSRSWDNVFHGVYHAYANSAGVRFRPAPRLAGATA
jgi:glycosyltransferase involved in cell wall biosynthesis